MKKVHWLMALVVGVALTVGCEGGFVAGSKTVAIQSGQFIHIDGYVISVYDYPFEKVWEGSEAILKEMNAKNVEKNVKIGKGTISATVQDDKVVFQVEFQEKDKTAVSILVGLSGSRIASQLIHDRLRQRLAKNAF